MPLSTVSLEITWTAFLCHISSLSPLMAPFTFDSLLRTPILISSLWVLCRKKLNLKKNTILLKNDWQFWREHVVKCLLFLQFTVQATDNGRPSRSTTARVIVFVTRNQFAPTFIQTPYVTSIQENTNNNSLIYTVTAVDQDLQGRIVYQVTGTLSAPSFFRLDQDGRVYTSGNLRTDVALTYVVIHQNLHAFSLLVYDKS